MKIFRVVSLSAFLLSLCLIACNDISKRDVNAVIDASPGAAAGSFVAGGAAANAVGAAGGAVVQK